MKKPVTIITIIVLGIALLLWLIISLGRIGNGSDIQKLYGTKGILMTQKSELLKQDLDIRNKIDEINKEVIEIDAKLYKLINGTGLIEAGQPEVSPIEQVNQELLNQ